MAKRPGFQSEDCAACGHPRLWHALNFWGRRVGSCEGCPRERRCLRFVAHPVEPWDGVAVGSAKEGERAKPLGQERK